MGLPSGYSLALQRPNQARNTYGSFKKQQQNNKVLTRNFQQHFYFCIFAGSKRNFYKLFSRLENSILWSFNWLEHRWKGNQFSLCKSVVMQRIRILKLSLFVAWNATQFAAADLGILNAAIGESQLSYQGCLQIHAWWMVSENRRL